MIPKVADKRHDGKSSFVQLVTYVTIRDDVKISETLSPDTPFVRQSRSNESSFKNLIGYIERENAQMDTAILCEFPDGRQQVRSGDVVCETNCFSLQTAAAEMNAVAAQSRRVEDPVYHFILSWPVVDNPEDSAIFDSARECLKHLGMPDNQYVTAIHRDTNHVHCHVAVNRVNPVSYRAAKLWNDVDTLHKTCRRLELQNNWLPTNGLWITNENGEIVRPERDYKNSPDKARQLEYYADKESLYSYAVDTCRENLNDLFQARQFNWRDVHDVLLSAGLELRRKGEGLAVYDNSDNPVDVPIKASRLHPALTLSALEPRIGEFIVQDLPRPRPGSLVCSYEVESHYIPTLHVRDEGARPERRIQRANDRENLIADYRAYRNRWVRPTLNKDDVRARYQALSDDFRHRRETVSMINDPLLRKMMRHALAVDRMVATASLRAELKTEREALKQHPDARCKTYRQWVEERAMNHDKAAIAQLRGWAYRQKRSERTQALSNQGIQCAVADDIKAYSLPGIETQVKRDGAVVYLQNGKALVQDRGSRIEIADDSKASLLTGYWLAGVKSGEAMSIRGPQPFVQNALSAVQGINRSLKQTLPLTDPQQRQMAGYSVPRAPEDVPKPEPDKPRPKGPTFRPG